MKFTKLGRAAVITVAGTILLASCASNEGGDGEAGGSDLSGELAASGASSQQAAQEAWVSNFQTENPDVTVNYEVTGSGTGRDNFVAGASNFIGSDRAFDDEEVAAGGFEACATDDLVEVPVYISPVALAFNLEGVESLDLDAETIAGIFAGDITTWDDDAIASQNEGVELPSTAITPVHRSDASGTTETFATYLSATAPDVWDFEVTDEWPVEGGESAQQTAGVASAITAGDGTVGYLDASQIPEGAGQVHVGVEGEYVEYSADAASALVEASPLVEGRGDADLVFDVDPAAAPAGSYPIALVSYLIGCVEYEDTETAQLVQSYFQYVVSDEGQQAAADNAGSAPISDSLRDQALAAIELIQVG